MNNVGIKEDEVFKFDCICIWEQLLGALTDNRESHLGESTDVFRLLVGEEVVLFACEYTFIIIPLAQFTYKNLRGILC